ncbi:MAG: carboxylesterase family protein [bacterium]
MLTLVAACASGASAPGIPGAPNTTAVTSLGTAQGFVTTEGVAAFLGLPYAEPPVGARRFAPPLAVQSWPARVDATSFGPACPQPPEEFGYVYTRQDEDCLHLNVWTPSADDGHRPVMVWVHGGAFAYEGTEDPFYSGARLAARGQLVVVSIEYRLGALGFTQLEGVEGSGNAAILDERLALTWVRDHIASFGGDPGNVTLFGQSAGGMAVAALLGLPGGSELIHKAIVQANVASLIRPWQAARAVTGELAAALGLDDERQLRDAPVADLLAAQAALGDGSFGPTFDGVVFPVAPMRAVELGSAAHVPVLTGTTRDEARGWLPRISFLQSPLFVPAIPIALLELLTNALAEGVSAADAVDAYQRSNPGLPPNLISMAIGTDALFRLPILHLAESQLAFEPGHVFVYRFDWVPPSPDHPGIDMGARHAAEVGFTLGTPDGWPGCYGPGGESAPRALVDQMMDAWIAFARTGDPSVRGGLSWPPYDTALRPTMVFDADGPTVTTSVVADPGGDTRALWIPSRLALGRNG